MKRASSTIILVLISAFWCLGQGPQKYTPIKDVIQQRHYQTFCIRAEFAGVYDSSKLIFFVNEDDYIIPVRLQKRDLGAEKRFLARDLQEGDVIVVKGMLDEIDIDYETYKGLVEAVIVDEEDISNKDIEEEEVPFAGLDVKPSFRGGDANEFSKWVNSQLIYPKTAKKNGVQGRVTLQFTVEPDGRITNVSVLRGVDSSLDREAVRVVSKSPRWTPGLLDGKPVRVTYTFPVIFQLR